MIDWSRLIQCRPAHLSSASTNKHSIYRCILVTSARFLFQIKRRQEQTVLQSVCRAAKSHPGKCVYIFGRHYCRPKMYTHLPRMRFSCAIQIEVRLASVAVWFRILIYGNVLVATLYCVCFVPRDLVTSLFIWLYLQCTWLLLFHISLSFLLQTVTVFMYSALQLQVWLINSVFNVQCSHVHVGIYFSTSS